MYHPPQWSPLDVSTSGLYLAEGLYLPLECAGWFTFPEGTKDEARPEEPGTIAGAGGNICAYTTISVKSIVLAVNYFQRMS